MSEAPCLKVPKVLGEKAILLTRSLNLFNKHLRIHQIGNYIYIPLIADPSTSHLSEFKRSLPAFEVTVHGFPGQVKRSLKLVDMLEDKLPPHLLASLPRAIDFVGDIAVIEIPLELKSYKKIIGNAILRTHRHVQTVLEKAGAVEGVYRLREFELLAGVDKTETIHKEYGCVYHVNLTKAYFSPRLSHEHNRVTSQVREYETIVDMFTGVGSFAIQIAKKRDHVQVFAIDANPDAIQLLKRNISMNHVEEKVTAIAGDIRHIVKKDLIEVADRVIMNLPEKAIKYVDVACEAIKSIGGIIHYYEFANAPNPLETAKSRLTEAIEQTNRNVRDILLARTVRATAPYAWQVVVDAEIQ